MSSTGPIRDIPDVGFLDFCRSQKVIDKAREAALQIISSFAQPNRITDDVQKMVAAQRLDPLHDFSQACREELQALAPKKRVRADFWSVFKAAADNAGGSQDDHLPPARARRAAN